MRSWRSTDRSAPPRPARLSTSAAGTNMRCRAKAVPSSMRRPGYGERPPVTGWFAEFEDLTLPPGSVGYAKDARRFMGATFDPSALYRFNAVQRMLARESADDSRRRGSCRARSRPSCWTASVQTPLGEAELLNPARRRAACPLPRLPQPARPGLVFAAEGARLHHRRSRRRPEDRIWALSGRSDVERLLGLLAQL